MKKLFYTLDSYNSYENTILLSDILISKDINYSERSDAL